jgi:hypothetical protein
MSLATVSRNGESRAIKNRWRSFKSRRDEEKVAGVWKARQRLEPPVDSASAGCALKGREKSASFRLPRLLPPLPGRMAYVIGDPAVSPPATLFSSLRDESAH